MIQENNYVQANKSSNQEDENHIQQPVQKEENIIESFMNTIQEAIQEPITMMEEAFRGQAKTKAGQRARSWWAISLYILAITLVLWYLINFTYVNKMTWNIKEWKRNEPFSTMCEYRIFPATTGGTTGGTTGVTTGPTTDLPATTDAAQKGGFSINDISVTTAHM